MKYSHRSYHTLLFFTLLTLSLLLGAPIAMASIFGKSELSGVWKERFQDINKLNEYTQKGLKAEISDTIIKFNYTVNNTSPGARSTLTPFLVVV